MSTWSVFLSAEGLLEGAQPGADADSALTPTDGALRGAGSRFGSYWKAGDFAAVALKYVMSPRTGCSSLCCVRSLLLPAQRNLGTLLKG